MVGIIAVHVGAGIHSPSLLDDYKSLMKKACNEAVGLIKSGCSALDAVCHATTILENSSLTNAGYGSSLTYNGEVECDASVMNGHTLRHGAVGAVPGVQNPVQLARKIHDAQADKLPGGLVSPSFLAGAGARLWAETHGIAVCMPEELMSEKSINVHKESIHRINLLEEQANKRRKCSAKGEDTQGENLLDTVGAICVDSTGSVASAVSSGGLLLKHQGRIGQASIYGCGCWAEDNCEGSGFNIAVSTSGCGEHLVRTMFAHLCARSVVSSCSELGQNLAKCVQKNFLDSPFLKDVHPRMAGSLILRFDPETKDVDLFWLHTTHTMGVAYMSVSNPKPQAIFTDLPLDKVGLTVNVNCKSFVYSQSSERSNVMKSQQGGDMFSFEKTEKTSD